MPLLSDATKLFVGTTPITRVLDSSANILWPKEAYEPNVNVMHRFTLDQTLESLPPYVQGVLEPRLSPDYVTTYTAGRFGDCLLVEPQTKVGAHLEVNRTTSTDTWSVKFVEAYIKVGMVPDGIPANRRPVRFSIEEYSQMSSWAAQINLDPRPDNTMIISRAFFGTSNLVTGDDIIESTIPYDKPRWLHLSVAQTFQWWNEAAQEGRETVTWSIDGKVYQKTYFMQNVKAAPYTNKVSIVAGTSGIPSVDGPDTVLVDEVRTASAPLYTSDFNPAR